jgi:septum formation inhibitor MinC
MRDLPEDLTRHIEMKRNDENPSEPLTPYTHHQYLSNQMNKTSHFIRLEMFIMALEALAFDRHTSKKILNMLDEFSIKLVIEFEGADPNQARVMHKALRRRLSFSMAEYDERVAVEQKQSGGAVLQLVKAT